MKAIFHFHIKSGRIHPKNPVDWDAYKKQMEGKDVTAHLDDLSTVGEKKRMYNYFHGPVLDTINKELYERGEHHINKELCKGMLKAMFLKDHYIDRNGDEVEIIPSLGRITKDELKTFIEKTLQFIREDLDVEPPDPSHYKLKLHQYAKKTDK